MTDLLLVLPGAEALGAALRTQLGCAVAQAEVHRFPDGENLVRLHAAVRGYRVLLAACLDHPDDRTLPLLFAADAARELGASEVGLVVPYLPYMRQDQRFHPDEALSSRSYARILSRSADFLVTVQPHLHRWHALRDIYPIRTYMASAAPAIAGWLAREAPHCVLVGPDAESAPWVAEVARRLGAPWFVMEKERSGDRDVAQRLPSAFAPDDRLPVLLDDVASTGATLAGAAQLLRAAGWRTPMAVVVHALMAPADLDALLGAGVSRVASCNTVAHSTNAIDVNGAIAEALAQAGHRPGAGA